MFERPLPGEASVVQLHSRRQGDRGGVTRLPAIEIISR